jgi:hypothetical protein
MRPQPIVRATAGLSRRRSPIAMGAAEATRMANIVA